MAASATLPSLEIPERIRRQRLDFSDGESLSLSHPPSPGEFNRLKITRQSSGGSTTVEPKRTGSVQRPRSASVLAPNFKKRSLRLHGSRPSSALGSRGRAVDNLEKEAGPQKVEVAFARIRQQLTQLGEEDQVLQNRLVTLNEEIKKLGKYAHQKKFQRVKKKAECAPSVTVPTLMVSGSRGTLVVPLESMQEESQDCNEVREEEEEEKEKERKSSCGDSSGSVSDASQGGCVLVIKQEGEHSPLSSGAEDDVFFT